MNKRNLEMDRSSLLALKYGVFGTLLKLLY